MLNYPRRNALWDENLGPDWFGCWNILFCNSLYVISEAWYQEKVGQTLPCHIYIYIYIFVLTFAFMGSVIKDAQT
jgi:hypothetical protein